MRWEGQAGINWISRLGTGSTPVREGDWEQIITFWGDDVYRRRILMLEAELGMDLASGES